MTWQLNHLLISSRTAWAGSYAPGAQALPEPPKHTALATMGCNAAGDSRPAAWRQMMWYVGRFGKDWGGEKNRLFLLVRYFGKDGGEIKFGKRFSETMWFLLNTWMNHDSIKTSRVRVDFVSHQFFQSFHVLVFGWAPEIFRFFSTFRGSLQFFRLTKIPEGTFYGWSVRDFSVSLGSNRWVLVKNHSLNHEF